LSRAAEILEIDEMRLGLQGRVRRVWATRGVKVVQKLQFVFEWTYLLPGFNPRTCTLTWDWINSMKQKDLHAALCESKWTMDAVIWDSASSHRSNLVAQLPFQSIFQPSYSPELNPVERIFEELRRVAEGVIYETLEHKKQVVENELRQLADDPQRLKRLAGWDWLCDALDSLPAKT
jgi:hypothetical protein